MSPLELFDRMRFWVSSLSNKMYANKPGAVIERMTPEQRETIKELKSSDIENPYMDDDKIFYLKSEEVYLNEELVKAKLEFDKKQLKK